MDIYTQLSDVSRTESVCKLIGKIIELTKYIDYLDIEFGKEDSEQKQENLKELMNLASRYDGLEQGEGLSLFLEDIALITDSDREGNDDNMVSLMTVHLAKGLEFKNVVIA